MGVAGGFARKCFNSVASQEKYIILKFTKYVHMSHVFSYPACRR